MDYKKLEEKILAGPQRRIEILDHLERLGGRRFMSEMGDMKFTTAGDIVVRLRNPFPSNRDMERKEAADEIERLREAMIGLLGVVDWANSALARGDDEQWVHHNLMKAAGKAREAIEQ